jgi:hypothetical protein
MIFLELSSRRDRGDERKFSALEIHQMTGCPYGTIRNQLPKWAKWGYLLTDRRQGARKGTNDNISCRSTAVYKVSSKARHYVNNIPEAMKSHYQDILNQWRKEKSIKVNEYPEITGQSSNCQLVGGPDIHLETRFIIPI